RKVSRSEATFESLPRHMKKILISENNKGQRIDKFLAKEFFDISRGEIIRRIKEKKISVNDKNVKPSYVLKEKDIITISKKQGIENTINPNININLEIIYEDDNIVVVDKPAGIQVHPDHNEKINTLVNALIYKYPEIKNVGEDAMRPGIVHRLDKDTSGIIIVARNKKSFSELKKKFQSREIEKKYWAIVYGRIEKSGVIDKPLARATSYRKQIIAGKKTKTKIREAISCYKVLKKWNNFTLVEVTPKTGRFHQIRVHLASIGHPVVGDKLYKLKKIKPTMVARQLLHAKSINFELFGKNYEFEAKLPDDFSKYLTDID
ncbi:MAG TPA: RluA family pseudouridine synthase, partial [Patescibacteria group bacterium]|nr:RluA family pseudouridine synthase [Patescibacteria group bacterium]